MAIEEKGKIHILIHTEISEDFMELRRMLNMMEEICDMAAPENQERANRLFDKVLDLAREMVKSDANRSPKNIKPKDSK